MMVNAALPCWVESGGQAAQEKEEKEEEEGEEKEEVWSLIEAPPLFLDPWYALGPSRILGHGLGRL